MKKETNGDKNGDRPPGEYAKASLVKPPLENIKNSEFQGKTLLVVNTGSTKKKFILQKLNRLGLTIVILNKIEENWAKPYADHWILADNTNHNESVQAVKEFLATHPGVKINGVITFWEDDVLLTSKIAERLQLVGIPVSISKKARNKFLFREFCRQHNIAAPKYSHIRAEDDIPKIIAELGFPLVIKPVFGSSSAYVIRVDNEEELLNSFKYIKKSMSTEVESALTDGADILVEQYIDGDEVDVDILLQNGRIKFYSISDNTKTREPFFIEADRLTPSQLPQKNLDELIELADFVLEKMEVQDGCIHFEAKSTKKGPVPIEVNLRMGGDEIYSSIKEAWHVDLIENAAKIALGMHIPKFKDLENPKQYLIARTMLADNSGIIVKMDISPKLKEKKFIEDYQFFKKIGDSILVPPQGYEYFGWMMVSGDNYLDASDNLEEAVKYVQYDVAKFDPSSSIGITSGKIPLSFSNLFKSSAFKNYSRIAKLQKLSPENQRNLHIGIAGNFTNPFHQENNTGKAIEKVLRERGYQVSLYDFDNLPKTFNDLKASNVDLVFNVCEKINNSTLLESHAASIFDILNIPYTGSSSFTLSLCMDKIKVKKLLSYHKIPTPAWDYIYTLDDSIRDDLRYPLIVKPSNTDDSVGITNESVVTNSKELWKQLEKIVSEIGCPVVIEEYIDGEEYDVSFLGTPEDNLKVLPICHSSFAGLPKEYWHIFGFGSRNEQSDIYQKIRIEIPPKNMSRNLSSLVTEIALDTYSIFNCHDYGRVEVRTDKNNNPYILELNPNPAIFSHDILPKCAEKAGWSYGDLIEEIILIAIKRYQEKPPYYHLQY